ncbi:hypothetical protein SRB17_80110 [Streptomyces sp. RB17]|nr:hypothetical protein [Streptomyces sp. RB17]
MSATPTVPVPTPDESETSPKNEATHEKPENGLEPWLSAWLATGHENHRAMK